MKKILTLAAASMFAFSAFASEAPALPAACADEAKAHNWNTMDDLKANAAQLSKGCSEALAAPAAH